MRVEDVHYLTHFMAVDNLNSVYNRLLDQASKDSTFEDVVGLIASTLRGNKVQPEERANLRLIKTLLCGGESLSACRWILDQITSSEITAGDPRDLVATVLFPRAQLDNRVGSESTEVRGALGKIRTAFFQAEYLCVLKALVRSGADLDQLPLGVTTACARFTAWVLDMLRSPGVKRINFLDSELFARAVAAEFKDASPSALEDFKHDFYSAAGFVQSLQELSHVVREPEDVLLLCDKRFGSHRSIAMTPLEVFRKAMLQPSKFQESSLSESDESRIRAIHDRARRIRGWGQNGWVDEMTARNTKSHQAQEFAVPDMVPAPLKIEKKRNPSCETSCSGTSLSAYFEDLMSLLKRSPTGHEDGRSALDILAKRRPDLMNLDLTCENAQTKVPYTGLVNEALESYIRYQTSMAPTSHSPKEAVVCHGGCGAVPAYDAGNTEENIYTELISQQFYPLSKFPFNKSRAVALQILHSLDLSSLELVETFRDRDLLLRSAGLPSSSWQSPLREQLTAGVNEVFARQSAAEALGMSQEDFATIAGETYFASWFADLLQGLSQTGVKVQSTGKWSAAQLWGYSDSMAMVDVSGEKGLSCIRELMKRSELNFQDILVLIKTQTFNRDLIIVNKDGSTEFTNSIDDMRLLTKELKPLTEDICWRLQSFIRLRSKLGWSINDLDAAIYCLNNLEIRQTTPEKPRNTGASNFTITPFVIKNLAAIVKLSTLVDTEPAALLPLWVPIDSFGEKSFLYTRLCAPGLQKLFTAVQQQEDNTACPTLDEAEMAICAALKWPAQHLPALREAAGLGDGTTRLNLETLSVLYRHALICQMLSISSRDCSRFFKILLGSRGNTDTSMTPFDSPETTLSIIEKWRKLFDAGWTFDSICDVFNTTRDQRSTEICRILRLNLEELLLLKLNLATPTLSQFVLLQRYSELRESCKQIDNQSSLVSLIAWLSQTTVADISEVASRISPGTGWDKQRVGEILRCKYDNSKEGNMAMMASLQRLEVILDLQGIMPVDSRLRRAAARAGNHEFSPPITILTSLAQPCFTLTGHGPTDLSTAHDLRAQLTPTQASEIDNCMMAKRNDVLVAFLLQQDYITKQGITHADGLLQYLLLDKQIGPQVQTTRIKLAIAAVQQFIQDCLLGRESEVTKTTIAREEWEWRLEYSRWEAHIKESTPASKYHPLPP